LFEISCISSAKTMLIFFVFSLLSLPILHDKRYPCLHQQKPHLFLLPKTSQAGNRGPRHPSPRGLKVPDGHRTGPKDHQVPAMTKRVSSIPLVSDPAQCARSVTLQKHVKPGSLREPKVREMSHDTSERNHLPSRHGKDVPIRIPSWLSTQVFYKA
jgi:hypothetical protein